MQLLIRPYLPSDRESVRALFSVSIQEHIGPCFHSAITSPLYVTISLALFITGYLLGSVLGAVALPGVWVAFVYYCCHELYASYVRLKLQTDMEDIPKNFLSRPDDCLWVAEAQVEGLSQVVGMVAIVGIQSGKERHGELLRMITSSSCRRMGLGMRLAQTAIDFCRERGYSAVVLETSSAQTAASALYKKLGFSLLERHTLSAAPFWVIRVARVTVLKMVKRL